MFWKHNSVRYQSQLEHSTKWVNEVKWLSKGKVIPLFWPKDIQFSKLKLIYFFFSATVMSFKTKLYMKAYRRIGIKIYTNELSHMTVMTPRPIYNKNINSSVLQINWPISLKLRYIALDTQVVPKLFKWWPFVDPDLCHGKVKYEKMLIHMKRLTIWPYKLVIGKEYMANYEYKKSGSFFDLWPKTLILG